MNQLLLVKTGKIKGINEGEAIITVTNIEENKSKECIVKVKKVEVTNVSLDETSVNIGVGQKYILREYIEPSNAYNKTITWTSSNNDVISVDNSGNISANGVGEAEVIIKSTNGKSASCKFYVASSNPANTKKYVSDTFNVRTGPSTGYKVLDSVSRNDEIEILKETSNWSKVRLGNGIVGYTTVKSYSSSKTYYIENVPYLNQFNLGYPTGCEAVSATMAAQYAGYSIGVSTVVANTPTDTLGKRQETVQNEVEESVVNEETGESETKITYQEETVWVGGNPFQVFVGHPTKKLNEGSYGCFASPIATALSASGVPCSNISGCSIDTVYGYIQSGKPVVVWCKKMQAI